ncbi:PREDICTED: venom acid phosphatase Acph-1-like [Eufriesea mexicana]|uniref:venom acid phosphatase Acph-1-like n=1 Tax=Eufriesea mexicana TaxID=516756 RepID=UPI00083C85D6|nr:PREDICTED: venom acid phosphatase Acph-1-like [Eufriesea mexicana]
MASTKVCAQITLFLNLLVWLTTAKYQLESVQIVFRHGDRTPTKEELYPKAEHNPIYDTLGYGQLTEAGKIREFRLGMMLRQRYSTFLGGSHHYGDVFARSTDTDRTKMSLQLVLGGIYPPGLNELGQLQLSPISIQFTPFIVDSLLFPVYCPTYQTEWKKTRDSFAVHVIKKKYKDLLDYLAEHTGLDMTTSPTFATYQLYHYITSQGSINVTLPEWATKDVQSKIEKITALEYMLQSHTKLMKRLNGGFLVKEFIKNMNFKGNTTQPKIYIYSGHEINIAAFAKAHDFIEPILPAYGSAIIVEKLRSSNGKIYIQMLLWTGVTEKLITYVIPNCGIICSYDKYIRLMQDVIPSDEESNCLWNNTSKEHLHMYYNEKLN